MRHCSIHDINAHIDELCSNLKDDFSPIFFSVFSLNMLFFPVRMWYRGLDHVVRLHSFQYSQLFIIYPVCRILLQQHKTE